MRAGQTSAERIEQARASGHYEQWRERFTRWITVEGLTDRQIVEATGLSRSGVRMIIAALGLLGVERPTSPRNWRHAEVAFVRMIREYTAAQDRGW